MVRPLPGIWDSLRLDTAVTLPVGVEAYAAYALRAWLSASPVISARTRRFARWSAVGSLVLGMAGQVAWHLLSQAHVARAPWWVTTGVSCLPVLVLGMAAGLAHLLRADAMAAAEGVASGPDQADQRDRGELLVGEERLAAARLRAAGERVSRRPACSCGRAAHDAARPRDAWPRSGHQSPLGRPSELPQPRRWPVKDLGVAFRYQAKDLLGSQTRAEYLRPSESMERRCAGGGSAGSARVG